MNGDPAGIRVVKEGRLSLGIRRDESAILIRAQGEIDASSASCLIRELHVALQSDAERVIFDMSELDFIDSGGVAALIGASRRADGSSTSLLVVRPVGSVARRLKRTGVDRELNFLD